MRGALHVTNGDSAAGTLRETTLARRVLPRRDALHEGPVPAVADDALRRIRARFLADDVPAEVESISRWLEERDRTLAANGGAEFGSSLASRMPAPRCSWLQRSRSMRRRTYG